MKLKPLFILIIMLGIIPSLVRAANLAPKLINLQAVLVDDGGNVLQDKQEDDISFAVIDGTGAVLYEEIQHSVPIIHGAISVLIGSGNDVGTDAPTGGLPYEALDPSTGDKILRFKLSDQTVPQEDIQLVSAPYAFYAQYASKLKDPIGLDQLDSEVIDLINAGNGTGASVPVTAKLVSVTPGHLTYANGNDVQTVLEGFDTSLGIQDKRLKTIETAFPPLPPDGTLDDRYVNADGDTMTGNLNMANANINLTDGNTVDGFDISEKFKGFGPGDTLKDVFVDTAGDSMIGNLVMNADIVMADTKKVDGYDISEILKGLDPNGSPLPEVFVNEAGDEMTGDLTMTNANINMSPGNTVDGVDVSELKTTADNHETRITILERCNNPQDINCDGIVDPPSPVPVTGLKYTLVVNQTFTCGTFPKEIELEKYCRARFQPDGDLPTIAGAMYIPIIAMRSHVGAVHQGEFNTMTLSKPDIEYRAWSTGGQPPVTYCTAVILHTNIGLCGGGGTNDPGSYPLYIDYKIYKVSEN